jgi:uncharacterized membrane protein YjdF
MNRRVRLTGVIVVAAVANAMVGALAISRLSQTSALGVLVLLWLVFLLIGVRYLFR